jgi:hypothetical protein
MTSEEILFNLCIGVTGSVLASGIVIAYSQYKDKEKIKQKFSGPVGTYVGYGHTQQGGTIVNMDIPLSEVTIKYIAENKLHLTLKEIKHPHQWAGIVAMETESYGTLAWRYDILHGKPADMKTHQFGFKRLMYLTRENKKIIYLIGEEGYGKEILIEKTSTLPGTN